jgi:tetratricopeptide (TPR) repeat protein
LNFLDFEAFVVRIPSLEIQKNYSTMILVSAFRHCFMKAASGLVIGISLLAGVAHADNLAEVSQLVREQRYPQALKEVEFYLATHSQDARAKFIKGVILVRQERRMEAINIFSELTQKHPELPEPYNNLAVLYAEQGQYEKARQALDMAMKTHPSYSVAYENLSGVYAKMASDAYDKALQVERGPAHPLPRLAMLDDVVLNPLPRAEKPVPPVKIAQTVQPPVPVLVPPIQPKPPVPPPVVVPVAKPVESKAPPVEPVSAAVTPQKAVIEAVNAWASAWSAKDIKAYLACYADDFKTPNGESRAEWIKGRKERISKPVSIKVQVLNPKVSIQGDRATVAFKQSYRAGDVAKRTGKTLYLRQVSGKWLIVREEAGK